jgi:crossover junction endodeoxyribonuclease RusA
MLISLPWPPKQSSPNGSQGNFYGKAAAGKKYRDTCLLECIAQKVPRMDGLLEVDIMFCAPNLRRYDLDNALAKAKRGLDAVAERIGVDDADWHKITLRRGAPIKGGRIFLTVKETTC